jgi:hypothetical protein
LRATTGGCGVEGFLIADEFVGAFGGGDDGDLSSVRAPEPRVHGEQQLPLRG